MFNGIYNVYSEDLQFCAVKIISKVGKNWIRVSNKLLIFLVVWFG